MKTRSLGSLRATELGLGGGPIAGHGVPTSEQDAREAVDAAWAGGVRYFDTAPHYGLGLSERRMGAALADRPRSEFIISTKVGRTLEPNPSPTGSDLEAGGFAVRDDLRRRFDYSADAIRRGLEQSLERLGLDRVDVVYVHDADDHVEEAISEALPALAKMRDEGMVAAIGVGMNQWQAPLRMVQESDVDVVMLAGRWTLLDRSGRPLLDACAERGVRVVAAAPFNSGVLAAPRPDPRTTTFNYGQVPAPVLAAAQQMADMCEAAGTTLPAAAVQFPLREEVVGSVVCGLRSGREVAAAIDAYESPIPEELWDELEQARTVMTELR